MQMDVPKLEDTTVACLNRILRTRYGSSLLLQYIVFLQAGLQASSESIRCLACKSVYYILENNEDKEVAAKIIIEHDICPLLINCLLDGNEGTFSASMSAIRSIAKSAEGINAIFPFGSEDPLQLKTIAGHCSSLARIRILALIKELFSLSENVASLIYSLNLLKLFEVEINGRSDMLTILSALEILYELTESPHSAKFLLKTCLIQLLTAMISNDTVDSILRSRAMLISGRLLSTPAALKAIDQSRINALLLTIDGRLNLVAQSLDEVENALEAVGRVGSSADGAELLLASLFHMIKHVVELAFDRQGRRKQLVSIKNAALHALGSIAGADRSSESVLLNESAEESFKLLIYEAAVSSPKLTPSGLFLSILQQEPEMRLAAYRLITALAARKWCLMELCSKLEITSIVMDASIEDTMIGMEARHQCCAALSHSLSASHIVTDAKIANLSEQLQKAVKRGPYLTKKRIESQPIVMSADRF